MSSFGTSTTSTLVVCLDTETTGLDHVQDHVIQLASVSYVAGDTSSACAYEAKANPGIPIPLEASNVHGVFDKDVQGLPPSKDVVRNWWSLILSQAAEHGAEVVAVAHNAGFDVPMLAKYFDDANWPNVPVICTLRTARRLDPLADNHKLTTLVTRYKLSTDLQEKAHDALADVWMAALLLEHYIKDTDKSINELAEWLSVPEMLTLVPFGKNKGLPFSNVAPSSLRWFLRQPGMDPDVVHTASTILRAYA
jgi:DNA polymerase III epsilon subunit-like protein